MNKSKVRYKYNRGYFAFQIMAELHRKLFPKEEVVDGGSRRASAIFQAIDKAYNDGVEDTLQASDEWIAKQRKRIGLSVSNLLDVVEMNNAISRYGREICRGEGKVERVCSMACCAGKPKAERYIILPCGCHSIFVKCTCKVRERHCHKCLRSFIPDPERPREAWVEIEDPHVGTGGCHDRQSGETEPEDAVRS